MATNLALIMAGGQGTRFWPWSTAEKPKQFLPVAGSVPLVTQTFRRLARFIPPERIYVVAEARYRELTLAAIPEMAAENYIVEPAARNTAPCLIWAGVVLARRHPGSRLLVVPADHWIGDEETFAGQLTAALEMAGQAGIVTGGIRPDSPHTGYGYIQVDPGRCRRVDGTDFYASLGFREKPDAATAAEYVAAGTYYWNSGMFVYDLATFRRLLERHAPEYFAFQQELERAGDDPAAVTEAFARVHPESIDYALMEKAEDVCTFPAAFHWNDVGSWSSVYDMGEKDADGNVCRGDTVVIGARDSLVMGQGGVPVAVVGLENVAVIHTASGVLVAPRDRLQQVKDVIAELRRRG